MIAEIMQMAGYFTQVYIVVDGVEECPGGSSLEVVQKLFGLAGRNVNVLLNSLALWAIFQIAAFPPELRMDLIAVQQDISTYLDHCLATDLRFQNCREEVKKEIKDKVLAISHSRY